MFSDAPPHGREAAVRSVEKFLAGKKVSTWGQAYDINDPGRRRVAAEWLVREMCEWADVDE